MSGEWREQLEGAVARALWNRVHDTGIASDLGGSYEDWQEWLGNSAAAVIDALGIAEVLDTPVTDWMDEPVFSFGVLSPPESTTPRTP